MSLKFFERFKCVTYLPIFILARHTKWIDSKINWQLHFCLCTYVCVCVYIYICIVFICIYTYTYVFTLYTYIGTYVYIYVHSKGYNMTEWLKPLNFYYVKIPLCSRLYMSHSFTMIYDKYVGQSTLRLLHDICHYECALISDGHNRNPTVN